MTNAPPADRAPAGPAEPHGGGRSGWKRAGLAAAVAVLAIASWRLPVASAASDFIEWVRGLGYWGPAVLIVAYVAATVLMAPGWVLTLGAGYAFGLVVGTATVSAGSVLGATAAFLIGRYAARGFVDSLADRHERFGAIDRAVERSGWKIVLLTRLSPAFPFNVLNYLYGATRVRLRDYVLASFVGMLPGTVMYVYLGTVAGNLTQLAAGDVEGGAARQALLWVGLAATVAVTVLVTRLARRALAEESPPAVASDV
ncbi:TVP38/TMEM64 family protein [Botrimarina sp.]|uniref:TVP38/TMEM64 family protein n=1 Tax=Botrimarina sp. TaxID=2795802 RepID=UPI0032EDBC2D